MKSQAIPLLLLSLCLNAPALSQETKTSPRRQPPPPPVVSPEVKDNAEVTFRIRAGSAQNVALAGGDIPGELRPGAMEKSEAGVWEITVGPLVPGAYRYKFNVDGLEVNDPANPATSESDTGTWSLVVVPGSDLFDTRDVPHGAVAEVTYHSKSLGTTRRMHVYTPPGYEKGDGQFPVFYLLHGAFDCDDAWSTVGRAGFILDNLIASGQARPMIVVMPDGHTGPFNFGQPGALDRQLNAFADDFKKDVRPYIETHYRVKQDRSSRAIAGLSMGGAQTLDVALADLADYAYIGVYSSGIFGINGGPGGGGDTGASWEKRHEATLEDDSLKSGLKLFWFATGKDDFLLSTTKATVEMFKQHGFDVTYEETGGGHTWLVWRDYLAKFAPLLFQD